MKTQTTYKQGELFIIGYANLDAFAQVSELMRRRARILLVDIRLDPICTWSPVWNSHDLKTTYGRRYLWERRLGNLNHKHREQGIQLAEGHEQAEHKAAELLCNGVSLILLCACKDARACHRGLVAKHIQDAVQAQLKSGVQA